MAPRGDAAWSYKTSRRPRIHANDGLDLDWTALSNGVVSLGSSPFPNAHDGNYNNLI